MRAEPCCDGCMADRAIGGITYAYVERNQWNVLYEGRPTDTNVFRATDLGEMAWVVVEGRWWDERGEGQFDCYGYEKLEHFERAYIARAGRERISGEDAPPPPDNGEGAPHL